MIVLGIETSCDETSAAVVKDGRLLSNVVFTQEIHRQYGGVVPEMASRAHDENIYHIVNTAMERADIRFSQLDAIAVTYGPGLMGTLLVGLNYAKGLSIGLGIPFIGVNHMEGHLFANLLDNPDFKYPFLCLLVSGGHTQIWEVREFGSYKMLSNTCDDAAGEAFDKGARIMGLGYPGGPAIQRVAENGDPGKYPFTIPRIRSSELDFSFSGLKTALLYTVQKMTEREIQDNIAHLCASYQEVIVDTLIDRIVRSVRVSGITVVTVAGGVASNRRFREKLHAEKEKLGINVYFPKMEFCTDNAAMIAIAGYERLMHGDKSSLTLRAVPNLPLDAVQNV